MILQFTEQPESLNVDIHTDMTVRYMSSLKAEIENIPVSSKKIIANLSKVKSIDSSGIQLMIAWKKKSESENRIINFIDHTPQVLSIIDLYGLVGYFGDKLKISKKDSHLYSFHYGKKKGFY